MKRLASTVLLTTLLLGNAAPWGQGFAADKVVPVSSTKLSGCTTKAKLIRSKAKAHQQPISQYSKQYDVSADMVKAVIAVESCYNLRAVSPKGAQGLMQLMPATADRFGVADAFNANQNIHAGTRYLSWLLKRYDGDLHKAIAAYNAGEGAVDRYQGIPPYYETQNYVRRVLTAYNGLSGEDVVLPAVTARKPGSKKVKALTGKPGRGGWQANKAKAPHLFKR